MSSVVPQFGATGITKALFDPLNLTGLFTEDVKQPKTNFPPLTTTETGTAEAKEAEKQQKKRLAALQAGGQINTSRSGLLDEAPVSRASLLGS